MSNTSNPAPGWYPDPAAPTWSLRYWDGAQWTDKTTPRPRDPGAGPGGPGSLADELEPDGQEGAAPSWPATGQVGADENAGPPGAGPHWPGVSSPPPAPGPPTTTVEAPQNESRPSWRRRRGRPGLVVVALSFVVALLVYFVFPTGPGKNPGTTWFRGGVPGWDDVALKGWSATDGELLQAWVVPGPEFGPDHPFLAVARLNGAFPPDESATSVLQNEQAVLSQNSAVRDVRIVALNDGAPGLVWTNSDRLSMAPKVPLTDYSLFALKGPYLYGVFFETTSAAFSAEQATVRTVMLNFKATAR